MKTSKITVLFSGSRWLVPVLSFLVAIVLIVWFMPREEKFNYQFETGKPWKYGLLTAPYDFPIYKNAEALRVMNEKIASREVEKYYLCVVVGRPKPAEGKLEGFIFKDAVKNRVYVRSRPEPGARTAVTYYRTIASARGLSLVECRLGTGRTHQIRAQMAAAGAPLLGDGKYGDGRRNRAEGETGQLLYSYRLGFDFKTDAGELNYLSGASFRVERVGFADKYFPGIIF